MFSPHRISCASLLLILFCTLGESAWAYPANQEEARGWVAGADYDPEVPTPSVVLGYPLGESPASVPAMVAYARLLARSSERVQLEELGTSTEGDPLLLLVITASDAQASLVDRSARMQVFRDADADGAQRRDARAASRPAVWIGCSVHGDEASGVDAGLWLAYHLAADRSAATAEILQSTVVLIDPCQNPDGRRRYLQFERSFTRIGDGPDPSPYAIEHTQMWPGGRYNHYFFDLNRDWAFLTQIETRARVAGFLRWRPQVFVDLHEMGHRSSYFFPPPAEPVNPTLPEALRTWLESYGRANAAAFDAAGLDYYVGEDFDLFYPGYGDSWPSLQGAIGMTYEQGTSRGLLITDSSGKPRRYIDTVHGHFLAALSTCAFTAQQAEDLMDYYVEFQSQSLRDGKDNAIAEYVLSSHDTPAESDRLARILVEQGVEVWRTEQDVELRLRSMRSGEDERMLLPAGSFRIPLAQAAYPMLQNLLTIELEIDATFLDEEEELQELGLPNRFYDVTAWSLPLSHGVSLLASRSRLSVPSVQITPQDVIDAAPLDSAQAQYGYLLPYRDSGALRALTLLWENGAKVYLARQAMQRGDEEIPAGSLVLKRAAQPVSLDLDSLVVGIVEETGAKVLPASSAWSEEGPSLGSNRVVPLRRPRIVVVTGPGFIPSSVGSLQWTLEQEYGLQYSAVLLSTLSKMPLREVDVIVLPGMREDAAPLPVDELRSWVEAGGTLIAIGSALSPLLAVEEWLSARLIEDLTELEPTESPAPTETEPSTDKAPARSRSTPEERRKPVSTPGAILDLELLPRHFLGFGAAEGGSSALVLGDRLLEPGDRSLVAASYAAEDPRRAGFIWPRMAEALPGMAYALVESKGRGKVILFAEELTFRGAWPQTTRILLNAMLLGPSLGR